MTILEIKKLHEQDYFTKRTVGMNESLVGQAEAIVNDDSFRNYRVREDFDTALAISGLLKVEKTVEEIDSDRQLPFEEGLFAMLAGRFSDAIRASSDNGSTVVEADLNYRELNTIGDVAVVKGNAAQAPYFLDLNGAFFAAGGRDNKRLRIFFEILSGK